MGKETKLIKESEVTLTGHSKSVQALAWSLDGKKLATASSDTTARVWTVDAHRDGKELQLKEHSESVDGVAWSPTHTDMLATASADKCIRVWDIRARKSADIKMGDEVLNVAFSPDGNYIFASDKSETLRVVDVRNNKNKVVAEACFDGQYWVNELVVNSRSDVVLMCAGRQGSVQEKGVVEVLKLNQTGDKTELQSVHKLTSHAANCTAIAIDRESRHFATGAYDGSASIWDAAELVCLRPCCTSLEEGIQNLSFSADGSLIAGVCDIDSRSQDKVRKIIDICAVESGNTLLKIDTKAAPRQLAWHPSKLVLAYGGERAPERQDHYGDRDRRDPKVEVPITVTAFSRG